MNSPWWEGGDFSDFENEQSMITREHLCSYKLKFDGICKSELIKNDGYTHQKMGNNLMVPCLNIDPQYYYNPMYPNYLFRRVYY